MNENVEKVSSLLQKKIVPSSSSGYNESAMLCGIEKNESQSTLDSLVTEKGPLIEEIENANCIDLFQKIGVRTEFIGNSLHSYNSQLQESPYLAETLVAKIINKDITGSELAFLELFDTLRCKHMDAEAFKFIVYAYIKLEEQAETSEVFYLRAISFGIISKEVEATKFARYLIKKITCDESAKRYMSVKMYSTICEYYFKQLENAPWRDKGGVLYSEGTFWANKLIEFQKTNENGYFWLAKFFLGVNRRDKAKEFLRKSIYDPPEPKRDTLARLRCPKCCKLYLEEFRGSISFIQLEEIIVKGLNDCIVFKEEESSEYNDYETFFQEQLLKFGECFGKTITLHD